LTHSKHLRASPKDNPMARKLYLLRHGEKPLDPNDRGLTERGRARAKMLAEFLSGSEFGPPDLLVATKTSKDGGGIRTQETLAPLAERLRLDVEVPFGKKEYAECAQALLITHEQNIIVCWDHVNLPPLARSLGIVPPLDPWPDDVFDAVWVVTFHPAGPEVTTLVQPAVP